MIQPHGFTQQGWECPKCGKVYSPSTPMCFTCPQKVKTQTTINTPLANGGTFTPNGTTTSDTTFLCLGFVEDSINTNATKCMRCGQEKHQHAIITYL